MNKKHDWQVELPKKTVFRGVTLPVYLDKESIGRLRPEHYELANWHVHIGKHVNTDKRGAQRKALEDFEKKLKAARLAYKGLADNDKARIDELDGLTYFDELIEKTKGCIENPLAERSKYENLYQTFATSLSQEERKQITRRGDDSYFQLYMVDVMRHVESDYSTEFGKIISRVTRAYKRAILGQK